MNKNVGNIDRLIRVVVGVLLIALTLTDYIGVWGWIGIVPLLTGVFRVCPAYCLLRMNTCGVPKKNNSQ